ncbi:helix-turn-helix domain-containing protein [Nesterenkonia muleiensis]|uniref:helix-turn-helix domain-containing protein n=1 Tax=Nesterenkonia muleiensis TaxID=2282648 RepID=UPI000E738B5D|nr:GAF domain-containing protein [Nesterenkonia muleiensis]
MTLYRESATALDQAVAHNEEAQRELSRLRRREHELGVLFSSAGELAAIQDSDLLLQRIVQRAHQMMAGDLSYLSEYDPSSKELFVRTTVGSVSADFRSLRVPPGKGLASLVVEQRVGGAVRRYTDFEAERHVAEIDAAVDSEGIVSMAGVPMLADDEVLGVLFVATRQERVFGAEDLALMTALANHASVVLQTARTLRDLRVAQEESRAAIENLREHVVQRDRAHAVHRNLVDAVLKGGGFPTVAETLASELARPVLVVDDAGRCLAQAGRAGSRQGSEWENEVPPALESSRVSGTFVRLRVHHHITGAAAMAAGDRHFGAILLGEGEFGLEDIDVRTVERAAQVGALLVLSQEAVAQAEHKAQSELVADLLSSGQQQRRSLLERARRRGMEVVDFTSVLVLSVRSESRSEAARSAAAAAEAPALVGEYRGLVVVLSDESLPGRAEHIRRAVSQRLGRQVLGVTPPTGDIGRGYEAARRTVRLLEALGVRARLAKTEDYLPYAAIFETTAAEMEMFLDGCVGQIRRYDTERGTELLQTMRTYVTHGASPTKTARAMNYHVNTILQRLERLDRLLEPGWREGERYFRISLAVRLDEVREQVQGQERGFGRSM